MPLSVSKYLPRHKGTTKTIDFDKRPICKYCKTSMKIVNTAKPVPIVGLLENYDVIRVKYRCGKALCIGGDEPSTSAKNTIYPPKSDFDYEVHAKVVELRWNKKLTYEEIIDEMNRRFGILLNLATIERMLKAYEIGCSEKYKHEYVEKIKKNGGVLLTIDGMRPSPGNPGLYTVRDHFTGLTIHSKHLKSESTKHIVAVLEVSKRRIAKELGVSVVGIVSDALPAQRNAIKEVFPEVPHCLCHYHFFKFVFDAPKKVDSHLMTQTRKFLKGLYYLNKSTLYDNQGKAWEPNYSETKEFLEVLTNLAKWKPRPRDPYFVGLELFSRLTDMHSILDSFVKELEGHEDQFKDEYMIKDLYGKITNYLKRNNDVVTELQVIKGYLVDIKAILDDEGASAEESLDKFEAYVKILGKRLSSEHCGETERHFIIALQKYVENKGEMLFNYKRIEGAPRTNNSHELAFKQLKHFLRRVIGVQTANHYLLTHGERIVFVKSDENFEDILDILKTMDYSKACTLIRSERISRESIKFIIHDPKKWDLKLEDLRQKFKELSKSLFMVT